MTLTEKAAYLKGLFDGSDLNRDSKEVKIMGEMLELFSKMADKISELEAENAELRDYIEEIDEDLGNLEEIVYEELDDECDCCDCDDDDCDCYDDDDCDCDCHCCCGDTDFRVMLCPHCNEEIYFDDSIEPEELVCPACNKAVADIEEE